MIKLLVLTFIGQDRPGLVELVSGEVARHGGNWLESRMSRLGGQFAGIARVSLPEAQSASLAAALHRLGDRGLTVSVHSDVPAAPAAGARVNLLELVGQDRPGIVNQLSAALAAFGINVEDLETECSSAAMSGETLFRATARLSIPPSVKVEDVRRKLEEIASDLIVDIRLSPAP
jgi:glycine cleavage system regulatory protein